MTELLILNLDMSVEMYSFSETYNIKVDKYLIKIDEYDKYNI